MADATPSRARAAKTILERTEALDAIESTLAAARDGSGRCLVLEGAAGLGKSRLAEEACDAAGAGGMRVLRARGAELERDFSFGTALRLFEPLLAGAEEGREILMSGAAALSEPLFAAGVATGPDSIGESEFPLLHGLHWLTANASDRAPVLVAVDDAHWADPPSLRFLIYLLQRLDELPIAMLVTARPRQPAPQGPLSAQIAGHRLATVIPLQPLSEGGVAQLVRLEVKGADDDLCAACAATTGGNPFYVRELAAALAAGASSAPGESEAMRGEPVSKTILGRIAGLAPAASELASAAAVLGDGAPLERAAELSGLEADEAARAADALAGAAILESGAPLSFIHPIVREAVYGDIPGARRARAHARAAELLRNAGADPELIASHLVEAHGAAGEWSVAALRDAAARARERGAPSAAARYLREALGIAVAGADRAVLLKELALAEARGNEDGAVGHAQEAIDAIEGARDRAEVALEIGMALVDGRRPEAEEIFERGLESLSGAADGDDELAMALRSSRAAIRFDHATTSPGELDAILARAGRGLATPAERLMLAHGALAPALQGRDIDEIGRLARASLGGPLANVTSPTAIAAFSLAATALFMTGALAESERMLSMLVTSAYERGAVLAFGTLSHVRAHALHRLGRPEDAIVDAQSTLDTARYGWEPELPAVHAVLALCLIETNELDAAAAALDVPGGEERWSKMFTWSDLLEARGRLRLARGEDEAALEDFLACGQRLEPLGASHPGVVPWRSGAVEAAIRLGKVELAGELASEDLKLARGFGAAREIGLTLRAAGAAAGGDRGIELLREAVETLRESEATLELAYALCDLGGALLEEGHRLAAREALAEALDLAHRCRASRLEETARERLVATGARPRRHSARGSDALTPRERRIAQMAAAGLGNREIAEALFITTKTVETHLGRAYRKLEVPGRVGLADALGQDD
jgi:DNA-binding CsgD family transcriptional regulator